MAQRLAKGRPGDARLGPPTRVTRSSRPGGDSAEAPPQSSPPRGLRSGFERVVLAVLTTLVSVNIWTGGPVFALWVGSRIESAVGRLSMAAVGATIGVLVLETFVLYRFLALLHGRYNAVIGRVVPRRQAAWLKPMSGERRSSEVRRPLSAVERIVVGSVVVAVLALEIWFFFFAHYTFAS
jgi:hypothetical protein